MTNGIRKYATLLRWARMVPYHVTELSDVEFAKALQEGYKLAFGQNPTAEMLAGGWAQAVLESGRPVKLPNNNVGNIKATPSWAESNDFFVKDALEFTPDGEKFVQNAAKWRAYASPAQGAAGYWKLIGNQRYKKALDWMAAGDPESASVVLGVNGYYTSSIKNYARYSNVLYKEFMDKLAPALGLKSSPAPPPSEKLPIKNFAKEYSKEEKLAINNVTEKEIGTQEVNTLINSLYACDNKLTRMVKNSILKRKLPVSDVLVCVSGDNDNGKLEFARVASSILRQHIDAAAFVCSEEGDVEIQCSALGTESILADAIRELCEFTAERMNKHTNANISVLVMPGFLSKYSAVDDDDLIKNRRHFNMIRIING